jgi:putative ABC transport system substrate-binding protein
MKYFFFHIAILFILFSSAPASGEVLVVQSLPIKPYDEALQGFRSICKQRVIRLVGPGLNESAIADKVKGIRPDLVLAIGQDALLKLKAIKSAPVVYVMVLNPATLLRDGDNITGVKMKLSPEKQISLLREIIPSVKRIGVFFDPAKTGQYLERINIVASAMGIDLVTKQVHSSKEAISSLDGMKDKVDALWLLPDTTVVDPSTIDLFLLSSLENKLPVITFSEKYAEKGALLSMEVDAVEAGKQAGEMAESILAGKSVKSIEDVDTRGCILTVNMIVAKKLGITIKTNSIKQSRMIR